MSEAKQPTVEFWFDPICPWCWITSRWVAEVAELRGFDVDWHPVSLKVINEGHSDQPEYQGRFKEAHLQGHRMGRVIETARRYDGEQVVGALYTAFGERIHPGGRKDHDAMIAEVLDELGLNPELAGAADLEDADAQLRENTRHALDIAGPDVGVPVISVNGVAFFGPVVTPAPKGDEALRLWDGIVAAASVPGFYELKRGRTTGPEF